MGERWGTEVESFHSGDGMRESERERDNTEEVVGEKVLFIKVREVGRIFNINPNNPSANH